MSNLSKFLKKNKKLRENTSFAATKSIADENGNALEWAIKPLTTKMNEDIRDECTVEVPVDKKRHMYRQKLNTSKYGTKLIVASVIEPDLNNAELQDSYGVKTPDELVQEMIDDPGEFAEFQKFIQEFNGFTEKDNEAVDEAKN
ncbi:phage tail assembly chaperone [Mycobacteroides abscessus]|uniref:phage tail assembly chaperone n=1 Tax=unclassified Desemzia TaxID=2685243 RepID=UPI0009A7E8A6